jgi:hypothetical protein
MVELNQINDLIAADLTGFAFQQICNQGVGGFESLSRHQQFPVHTDHIGIDLFLPSMSG